MKATFKRKEPRPSPSWTNNLLRSKTMLINPSNAMKDYNYDPTLKDNLKGLNPRTKKPYTKEELRKRGQGGQWSEMFGEIPAGRDIKLGPVTLKPGTKKPNSGIKRQIDKWRGKENQIDKWRD